jgi:WhiB family redox-sensing transcriptional regulator
MQLRDRISADLLSTDPAVDWRTRAACRDEDPELFFLPGEKLTAAAQAQVDQAVAVCARCPVVAECRQDADDQHATHGVWGGQLREKLSTKMRLCEQCPRLFSPRRADQRFCSHECHHESLRRSNCGTTTGARGHRKRGEPVDAACQMAESLYRARRARNRRERKERAAATTTSEACA